jgi:hypothetical protein
MDEQDDLYLGMLMKEGSKKKDFSERPQEERLKKRFKKIADELLQHHIIQSNFDAFCLFLDARMTAMPQDFEKTLFGKID